MTNKKYYSYQFNITALDLVTLHITKIINTYRQGTANVQVAAQNSYAADIDTSLTPAHSNSTGHTVRPEEDRCGHKGT